MAKHLASTSSSASSSKTRRDAQSMKPYFPTWGARLRFMLNPVHWLCWCLVAVSRCLVQLPYVWQLKIGQGFGAICYAFGRKYRHIVDINLSLCFPHLSADARFALLKSYFRSAGIGAMEILMAFWMPQKRLQGLLQIEGLDNLLQAYAKGQGVILLSAHFTMLEICMRLSCENIDVPLNLVYRKQKNAFFNYLWIKKRRNHVKKLIAHDDIRSILSSLKKGEIVCYVPDQDFGRKYEHVFAPFFGVKAATVTSTSRLASSTQSPVLMVTYERLENAKGYRVNFHPPIENFPTGDRLEDASRINQLFASAIAKNPAQYFWHHRRFKTRPVGEPSFYQRVKRKYI